MKHVAFLTLFLSLCVSGANVASAEQAPDFDRIEALAQAATPDVRAFLTRKLECYHWAGEEPYDKARAHEIRQAFERLKCDTLDREENLLRKTHASSPHSIQALDAAKGL